MKKVKVMLTAIAIMAVVAGALAFKTRTYADEFCTRQLEHGPGMCEGWYIGKRASFIPWGKFYYTTVTFNSNVCRMVSCPVSAVLTSIEY
jgi:hypothetical protein